MKRALFLAAASCLIMAFGFSKCEADSYELLQAESFKRQCDSHPFICLNFINAVTDLYFLTYPGCDKPDYSEFMGALMEQVARRLNAMTPEELSDTSAVLMVYQMAQQAHPCSPANTDTVSPSSARCVQMKDTLRKPLLTDLQKQGLLLTMQNSGCFN